MFQTLLSPRKWGPAELLTITFMFLQALTLPFISILPTSFYILVFAFWRASYNIGLAKLLHLQSTTNAVTNWLQTASPSARALINWAVTRSMSQDYAWQRFPPSFNAWLAFRALSMVVLSNDGFSYVLLSAACFRSLSDSSYLQLIICVPLGLSLIFLSVWSKAAAHHVLGDFAWYWGDFFFTVDATLSFDGVFELFPHPMYTVGYAAYYGSALICRSYTLLSVSLVAHLSQLLFLAFVEEPHIQKTYPPSSDSHPEKSISADTSLHNTSNWTDYQTFTSAAPMFPTLASLSFSCLTIILLFLSAAPAVSVVVVVLFLCRALHWVAIRYFLHKPADAMENRWMSRSTALGYSRFQAYSTWMHTLLSSYMLNHVLFFAAAISLGFHAPSHASFSKRFSLILSGISLISLSLVSLISSWRIIGSFGFFYGDFFVEPTSHELKTYGSFRYVTNPQATLGYLAYYGLALIAQSRALFMLAIICQGMELFFIDRVESAHIRRKYGQARRSTALEDAATALPVVSSILKVMRSFVVLVLRTMEGVKAKHGQTLKREMVVRKERLEANLTKSLAKARDHHIKRGKQELKIRAESVVGELSCDNLVSVLENRGIVVERVSQPITEPGLASRTLTAATSG